MSSSKNICGKRHKIRFATVQRILERESDARNRFSVKQILDRLGLTHTESNMRAIRDDIKAMRKTGTTVMREKHKTFEYYVGSRKLSPYELRFATDAIQGSGSIDEQSSNKVAKSVLELGSLGEARLVEAGIRPAYKPKTRNTQVFHNIEIISEALAAKPQHKVQFLYYDIGFDLEKDYRYNGEARIETPLLLTYENGRYYMISYSEERDDIIVRRLDRMERVIDTGQKAVSNEKTREFDPEDFERNQFNMFLGKAEWITLQINDKKMMNPLYDRFGEKLRGHIEPPTKGKPATAQVKVIDSPQFRGWVEGMGGGLEIVEKKSQA